MLKSNIFTTICQLHCNIFTTIENDMQTQGSNRINMPPTTPPPEAINNNFCLFYPNL